MSRNSLRRLLLPVLLAFSPTVLSQERQGPFRCDIGNFRFPLNDPEIEDRVNQADRNLTAWDELWEKTYEYWAERDEPQNDDAEVARLRELANATQVDKKELEVLFLRARETYDAVVVNFGNDSEALWRHNRTDLTDTFIQEVAEEHKFVEHQRLVAWAGVGSSVDCSLHVNSMLDQMSEWEKSGMAAATTLMALLPTFLAFGNLFVPRSSEAFATSWLIGLGAALFSLGLPVRSLSCVRRKQVVELATLDKDPLDDISALGERNKEGNTKDNVKVNNDDEYDDDDNDVQVKATLEDLQKWTRKNPPHRYMREFARLRKEVENVKERWHWWHVPAVLVAACHGVIFGLAIEPLLKSAGIPRFIFGCTDTNWTGLYLSVSAATNAVFRLALWQLCDHEVVSIYSLSNKAKEELELLKKPGMETTATQLPPLYPPLISRFHRSMGLVLKKIFNSLNIFETYDPLPIEHPPTALTQPVRDQFEYIKAVFKKPASVISSGFTDIGASRRWRPLVVLIHLSTQGRPQLRTLFTGFIEAALLLALTFFLASQWGGNLYVTSIALALLLLFITLGRALAICYVWLSARTWGLHTINCDEQSEILGCLRIVCSMQGVLVVVNGAHYYNGYRLDYAEEKFKAWRKRYAAGDFDEPLNPTGDNIKRMV